jgi:hypothetical protein
MPMRLFWEFSGQVTRLQAEHQRLQLQVVASSQAPEAAREFEAALDKLAPDPVTLTVEARIAATSQPDPDAANTLRSLQG